MTHDPRNPAEVTSLKTALRRRVRTERRGRTPAERLALGHALADRALELPELQAARTVALYAAMPGEPQTAPLRAALARRGVAVLLPLVRAGGLEWARDDGALRHPPGGRGAPEPTGPGLGASGVLAADAVLVPALAVDTLGTRLGQGGGHYDAALPVLDPGVPVLAVVHDEEVLDAAVEALPAEPHDVPVDAALTPLRCLRLAGRA